MNLSGVDQVVYAFVASSFVEKGPATAAMTTGELMSGLCFEADDDGLIGDCGSVGRLLIGEGGGVVGRSTVAVVANLMGAAAAASPPPLISSFAKVVGCPTRAQLESS